MWCFRAAIKSSNIYLACFLGLGFTAICIICSNVPANFTFSSYCSARGFDFVSSFFAIIKDNVIIFNPLYLTLSQWTRKSKD